MSADSVLALGDAIGAQGAGWLLMGGWGVDALLGRQTREHKDLDVLVQRGDLRAVLAVLTAEGFRRAYGWEENRPLDDDGDCAGADSAFVVEDDAGRAVDIHVFDYAEGRIRPLWAAAESLAAAETFSAADLDGTGTIGGRAVRCLSAHAQLRLHAGYDLPPAHERDAALLWKVLDRDG